MQQKGAQTRKKIIMQAATLFNKRGFEGTSMQDVSHATGLEKGSLYTHFNNKEELAKEAFDYAVAQRFSDSVENMEQVSSAIEKLRLHIHNVASKPPFPGGCPLMNAAMQSDEGNSVLFPQAQEAMRTWIDFLKDLIKAGQTTGEINASVDAEGFSTLVISLLEGACLTARLQNNNAALDVAENYLNHLIDQSLKPQ